MRLSKKVLVGAIRDLNKTIGFKPPIREDGEIKDLREDLLDIALSEDDVREDDPIKDSTRKILAQLAEGDKGKDEPEPEPEIEPEPEPEKDDPPATAARPGPFSKYMDEILSEADGSGKTWDELSEEAQEEASSRGMRTKITPGRLKSRAKRTGYVIEDGSEVRLSREGDEPTSGEEPDKGDPEPAPDTSSETEGVMYTIPSGALKEFGILQQRAANLAQELTDWSCKYVKVKRD